MAGSKRRYRQTQSKKSSHSGSGPKNLDQKVPGLKKYSKAGANRTTAQKE
jgi:hypothetical protein